MITLAIAALLTVIIVIMLLIPLMTGTEAQQKTGWMLLVFITVGTMGVYLWRGSPDIPSQAASFETAGPNADKRALQARELELKRELAAAPEDTGVMLSLGAVLMQNGKLEEAIAVLSDAYERKPEEIAAISVKLGAAHYAAGLSAFLLDNDKERALTHLRKALQIAPQDAPYKDRLMEDMRKIQEEESD